MQVMKPNLHYKDYFRALEYKEKSLKPNSASQSNVKSIFST